MPEPAHKTPATVVMALAIIAGCALYLADSGTAVLFSAVAVIFFGLSERLARRRRHSASDPRRQRVGEALEEEEQHHEERGGTR
jgi:membrane protein implicated in regulation of membrane protease activity